MNGFTVVLDACILYPAPLRSLFMYLAVSDLFRAKWSADIHEEWIAGVLRDRADLARPQLERVRELMDAHVRDAAVTGYENLIPALDLPDFDDRHVLAAAIRCNADVIVTFNLRDFPAGKLAPYAIEAQHPDSFLAHQLGREQSKVLSALKAQRESLRKPPMKSLVFLDTLERQQLPLFVSELRRFADVI